MLDTVRNITTPELIELKLHPAGILPRFIAFIIDICIRAVIMLISGLLLTPLGYHTGVAGYFLIIFLVEWFYPIFCEMLMRGATPGKLAVNLVTVHENGTPIGWSSSIIRNFLRTADFLPFGYLFGAVSMLLHSEFRRLGDIVAGTIVVYRTPNLYQYNVPEASAIAPPVPLSRETQQLLVTFAERVPSLPPLRQEELANLLPMLSQDDNNGPKGVARLVGIANFLVGRKP